jgi:hypothetical protein
VQRTVYTYYAAHKARWLRRIYCSRSDQSWVVGHAQQHGGVAPYALSVACACHCRCRSCRWRQVTRFTSMQRKGHTCSVWTPDGQLPCVVLSMCVSHVVLLAHHVYCHSNLLLKHWRNGDWR